MRNDRTSILLIGSGRLARHLKHWNSLLKTPNTLLTWNRSEPTDLLNKHLVCAQLIWLCVSDSAIIPFYEQHLTATKSSVVHFSGALNDARLISAHPLMSFPEPLFADPVYENIHFSVTGVINIDQVLPGFENSFSVLPAEHKAFYHALCVVSGNFPQLLWTETFSKFQDLQIPEKAFDTYIRQITENFIQLKQAALTGPLMRKDFSTIEKNQASLVGSNLENIYKTFAQTFTKESSI